VRQARRLKSDERLQRNRFRMLSSERWMRRGPNASALVVGVDDQHVPSTSVAEGIFDGTVVI